ncbi:MAG: DUF362 domain-containing protein [Thermoanaerobaculia bacterium]
MSSRSTKLTRRRLLGVGSGWALAGLFGLPRSRPAAARPTEQPSLAPPGRSRVILIRDQRVLDKDGHPDAAILREMLNRALTELLEVPTPEAAWRRLIQPEDTVGVKSNAWDNLPTPPALEEAIREEVLAVGVTTDRFSVDDRGVRRNPVFKKATALINVRPMRTHHWSGLGTCLKNVIMFVPNPPDYHDDACAPLGALWQLPEIAGKVRLNILVMLTPQFHGVGPHGFSPRFTWPYQGLIVGTDPVAVDATGARIIVAKRLEYFETERPLTPLPHHIRFAETRYGIGNADAKRIDLVRLGWREDELI